MNDVKVEDKRFIAQPEETLPAATDTNTVIMTAMNKGYTPEFIEKMLDLQEKFEQNEARKAYHAAMSEFKKYPPNINKDQKVAYGTTAYSHASLGNVSSKINDALSQHGLSASWETSQSDKGITITCRITHLFGHSESTSLTAAPDASGGKNTIQAVGSTVTYLQRYTILALTGLATSNGDDDGKGSEDTELISAEKIATIQNMLDTKNVDQKAFFDFMGVKALDQILAKDFNKAVGILNKSKDKTKKDPEREPGSDDS